MDVLLKFNDYRDPITSFPLLLTFIPIKHHLIYLHENRKILNGISVGRLFGVGFRVLSRLNLGRVVTPIQYNV